MSDYDQIFRKEELREAFLSGEVKALDDLCAVEDAALTVHQLQEKVAFYKIYKKKKVEDVGNAIKALQNKINFFESIILRTLKANKEKSIKFPGSCSVTSAIYPHKWIINDEEEFIRILEEAEKKGEKIDDVLITVVQRNIVKKQANKLLDAWEQNGKLDAELKKSPKGAKPFVTKEPPHNALRYQWLQEEDDEEEELPEDDIPIKVKLADISDSLDG